jgi:hypothetical protein
MTETRFLTAALTKSPTDGTGRFEAIAYDASAGDLDGVVITPAGIDKAVRTFAERKRPLVLRWQHQVNDPDTALGVIDRVWRAGPRLMVAGRLDLKNALSVRCYEAMLQGRLNELSISWFANPRGSAVRDGILYESDIELMEISLVAVGSNRGTLVTAVKTAAALDVQKAIDEVEARETALVSIEGAGDVLDVAPFDARFWGEWVGEVERRADEMLRQRKAYREQVLAELDEPTPSKALRSPEVPATETAMEFCRRTWPAMAAEIEQDRAAEAALVEAKHRLDGTGAARTTPRWPDAVTVGMEPIDHAASAREADREESAAFARAHRNAEKEIEAAEAAAAREAIHEANLDAWPRWR